MHHDELGGVKTSIQMYKVRETWHECAQGKVAQVRPKKVNVLCACHIFMNVHLMAILCDGLINASAYVMEALPSKKNSHICDNNHKNTLFCSAEDVTYKHHSKDNACINLRRISCTSHSLHDVADLNFPTRNKFADSLHPLPLALGPH